MPSIAQQDYIVIKPKQERATKDDAAAMAQLAGIKERDGQLGFFDVLINKPIVSEGVTIEQYSRVIATYGDKPRTRPISLTVYEGTNDEIVNLAVDYSQKQYQGLAAVQEAIDEKYGGMNILPVLLTQQVTNYLQEEDMGGYICVDNKYLIATVDGEDKLISLTMADTGPIEPDAFVNITWEDAQKLIGLPIA